MQALQLIEPAIAPENASLTGAAKPPARLDVWTMAELEPALISDLERLTFGDQGLMLRCFRNCRNRPDPEALAIVAYREGTAVGWALLFRNSWKRLEAHFFVAEPWRRIGVASQLIAELKRLRPRHKIWVRPMRQSVYKCFERHQHLQMQGSPGYLRRVAAGEEG